MQDLSDDAPDNNPVLTAYAAISERAETIGWPLFHATELTEKDAHICAALKPEDAFVWVLREAGTTILLAHAELDATIVQSRLASLERVVGPCRFFWWDGSELEELLDAEEASFVLEDRIAELRYARRCAKQTMPPAPVEAL